MELTYSATAGNRTNVSASLRIKAHRMPICAILKMPYELKTILRQHGNKYNPNHIQQIIEEAVDFIKAADCVDKLCRK